VEKSGEKWLGIDTASGYEVSDWGRVRNSKTGRILRLYTRKDNDYVVVCLRVNGANKSYRVNRLVAIAFVPNSNPTTQIEADHEDKDRSNNRASNLKWITQKKNRSTRPTRTSWMPRLVKRILGLNAQGLSETEITQKLLRWKPWHR
jgi:hypothetical protein